MGAPDNKRRVLRWDPYLEPDDGSMQFRLTYDGELRPHRDTVKRQRAGAVHIHGIRRVFHQQLRKLWEVHPNLLAVAKSKKDGAPYLEWASSNYEANGFSWVPLVTERQSILCRLEVLMLRWGQPGGVFTAGDIDNRLKTICDALKRPRDPAALGEATPQDGETPFHVLLEDDSLITHAAVETDTLLQPINRTEHDVRLTITVNVRPYKVTLGNLSFAD